MRWWWRRRQRGPSPAAQHALAEAEDAVERNAGLAARSLEEIAMLRKHRTADEFNRLLIQTYRRGVS